ncbi:hypothetical protein CF327_g5142 [Tilletia walkeri]|nr:hypothetical protein CF327_g5142 [Tilletia walkeri]
MNNPPSQEDIEFWVAQEKLMLHSHAARVAAFDRMKSDLGDKYITDRPAGVDTLDNYRYEEGKRGQMDDEMEALRGPDCTFEPDLLQLFKIRSVVEKVYAADADESGVSGQQLSSAYDKVVAVVDALRSTITVATGEDDALKVKYIIKDHNSGGDQEQELDEFSTMVWSHYHRHGNEPRLDVANWDPERAKFQLGLRTAVNRFDDYLEDGEYELRIQHGQRFNDDVHFALFVGCMRFIDVVPVLPGHGKLRPVNDT